MNKGDLVQTSKGTIRVDHVDGNLVYLIDKQGTLWVEDARHVVVLTKE